MMGGDGGGRVVRSDHKGAWLNGLTHVHCASMSSCSAHTVLNFIDGWVRVAGRVVKHGKCGLPS